MLKKSNKAKNASVVPNDHAEVDATIFSDRFYAREWKHPPAGRTRLGRVEKEDLDRTADPEEKYLWRQHQLQTKAKVVALTRTLTGRKVAEKHMWSLFEDVYLLHKVGLPIHGYFQPDEGLMPFSERMAWVISAMKQYPRLTLEVIAGKNPEPFAHNPRAAWGGARDDMLRHIKNKLQTPCHAENSRAAIGQTQSEAMQRESGDHDMDGRGIRASSSGGESMRQEEPQKGEEVVEVPIVHTPVEMVE
ncbi:hypothetical protein LTR27_005125 [Elasticomyces elasticus]|nr:hypothetical protein LTR27_005125 [Elasticomyces elasticus]